MLQLPDQRACERPSRFDLASDRISRGLVFGRHGFSNLETLLGRWRWRQWSSSRQQIGWLLDFLDAVGDELRLAGDGGDTMYAISEQTVRQATVEHRLLGRVASTILVASGAAQLL